MAQAATLAALGSRSGMRRVLVAYGLYNLVELACWLAIVLWAYDIGGASLAGAAAVVQLLPSALLAPLVAGVGDRLPRGTALVLAHGFVAVAALLTYVALSLDAPAPVVILASTIVTTSVAVVRPVHYAALPQLADGPGELVSANALSSVGEQVGFFVGPVLAGFGFAAGGPTLVLLASIVVSVLGTLLCLGLSGLVAAPADDEEEGALRAAVRGLRELRGDWGSLALLLVMTTTFVIFGALDVMGVAYAESTLDRGAGAAGLLIGAVGIGGLVGAAVTARLAGRPRLRSVIVGAATVQGLAFASLALVRALLPAIALVALVGASAAVFMVCSRTLLQRATDDVVLTRVFAVQESMSLLGLAVGAALAPGLLSLFSVGGAFLCLGASMVAVVLASGPLIRLLDPPRSAYRPTEMATLRSVRFFDVLPSYDLERLAQHASWLDVAAGADVVRQGEEGHQFFVVGDGTFGVTVDGVRKDHVLGPGDSFGEIALLHAVPRTATITSLTDGRLLVLRDRDFLAAVTGSPDGRWIAAEVAARHLVRDRGLDSGPGGAGRGSG